MVLIQRSNISKGEKGGYILKIIAKLNYMSHAMIDDTISFSFKTLFFNLNNELDLTFLNY